MNTRHSGRDEPLAISRHDASTMHIAWKDGHESLLSFVTLREECPCASCNELRKAAHHKQQVPFRLVPSEQTAALDIVRVTPIGRYAVNIVWKDGHNTGIYSYELLRNLCRCSECRG